MVQIYSHVIMQTEKQLNIKYSKQHKKKKTPTVVISDTEASI